jgi:hypothetical protein
MPKTRKRCDRQQQRDRRQSRAWNHLNRGAGKRRNVTRLTRPRCLSSELCRVGGQAGRPEATLLHDTDDRDARPDLHAILLPAAGHRSLADKSRPLDVSSFLHALVTLRFHKQLFARAPGGPNQSLLNFALPKADQTGCVAAVSDCAALVPAKTSTAMIRPGEASAT